MDLSGAESWPPGVCLKYVGGDQFGHVNMVMVRSLDPQEMADVSVQMQSPVSPGMYQGQWRMCTATGLYYGGEDCNLHTKDKLDKDSLNGLTEKYKQLF